MTAISPPARRDHLRGIGLRLLAVLLMTAMSALVHAAAETAPVGQIVFWRSALAIPPILLWARLRDGSFSSIGTRRPMAHAGRGLFGALSMALSFASLAYLPVANAQALAYLAPILTLPVAAMALGEKISRAAIIASAVGFAGVIAMLFAAFEAPGEGALIGTLAGLGYAATMAWVRVHIKAMTATETAGAIAFWFAVTGAAVGLCSLPFGWAPLDLSLFALLAGAGVLGGFGHALAAEATRAAPVSVIAPYDYTGMIWALLADALIFGAAAGGMELLGAAAITVAGLILAFAPRR